MFKTKRKILALLLAAALSIGMTATAFAEGESADTLDPTLGESGVVGIMPMASIQTYTTSVLTGQFNEQGNVTNLTGISVQFNGQQADMQRSDITDYSLTRNGEAVSVTLKDSVSKQGNNYYILFESTITTPGFYKMTFKYQGTEFTTQSKTIGTVYDLSQGPVVVPSSAGDVTITGTWNRTKGMNNDGSGYVSVIKIDSSSNRIITFDNVNIDMIDIDDMSGNEPQYNGQNMSAIKVSGIQGTTIELVGNNTVTAISSAGRGTGINISVSGELTIQGDGNLTVNGGSGGIYAYEASLILDADVTTQVTGISDIVGLGMQGIYAGGENGIVTISGGNVVANGGTHVFRGGDAIHVTKLIVDGGTLTANGGNGLPRTEYPDSVFGGAGIYAKESIVANANITATGGKGIDGGDGIKGGYMNDKATLTIANGITVTATGGDFDSKGVSNDLVVTNNGGTLIATDGATGSGGGTTDPGTIAPSTLTAGDIKFEIQDITTGTATLTVASVPESFPINKETSAINDREYAWNVHFSDGQEVYAVGSNHWKPEDSSGNHIGTLSTIQSDLWKVNADGGADQVNNVSKPITTDTTLTWAFAVPSGAMDLTKTQYLGLHVLGTDGITIYKSYKIVNGVAQYLGDKKLSEYIFNQPITPITPSTPSGGGSSGSSSSRDGYTPTTTTSPSSNTPTTVTTTTATDLVKAAVQAAGSGTATVRVKNAGDVALDTFKAMAKAAGSTPIKFNADSISEDGKAVEVRMSLDPAKATKNVNLFASTTSSRAKSTETFFEKYYSNNVSVISLSQQGDFGTAVEVSAKIDSKLNAKTLQFYAYDKAKNTFTEIKNTNYFVDANGYVHFTTTLAGDIVITDKALAKK